MEKETKELIKKMKQTLIDLPDKVCFEESRLIALTNSLDMIRLEKKNLEQSFYKDICEETITVGDKVKPKYSNESLREAELNKRTGINLGYVELTQKEQSVFESISKAKTEVDYLRLQLRSITLLLEIVKIERGLL